MAASELSDADTEQRADEHTPARNRPVSPGARFPMVSSTNSGISWSPLAIRPALYTRMDKDRHVPRARLVRPTVKSPVESQIAKISRLHANRRCFQNKLCSILIILKFQTVVI